MRAWWLGCSAVAAFFVLGAMLVFVPVLSPATGAETADFLRSVIGPEPVARIESLSFQLKDMLYRMSPSYSGGPAVTWSSGTGGTAEMLADTPTAEVATTATATALPASTQIVLAQPTPTPSYDVVSAPPGIGWEAYGA
ncbi:MAG: hypothetical protein ACM3MF_04355, partial [Anaerolineae bacterium]